MLHLNLEIVCEVIFVDHKNLQFQLTFSASYELSGHARLDKLSPGRMNRTSRRDTQC